MGHQSASVIGRERRVQAVTSLRLDDLESAAGLEFADHIVLKLDIEGAETFALDGAAALLGGRDVLVIYEDHGKDIDSAATKYLLDVLGYNVHYIAPGALPRRVYVAQEASALKYNPCRGYNFFACRTGSAFSRFLAGS
jgi:hypothetical protein